MKGRRTDEEDRMAEPTGQGSYHTADRGGDGDDLLLFNGKRRKLR